MQRKKYILTILSNVKEKVISWPFKLLIVFIFLSLISWSIVSYIFSSNPLKNSVLSFLLEQGLHVSVLGEHNNSIYKMEVNPLEVVPIKDVPTVLKNAILAGIFVLNNNNPKCSPNLSVNTQVNNKCNYVYTDILIKNYILKNLIKTNLERGDNSTDLHYKLRYYLAEKWLEKNFSIDNFLNFLLNYGYYGEGVLGFKEASKKYFNKDVITNPIAPEEAAFLTKMLFDNTSYMYEYSDIKPHISNISVDSILAAMYELGYIDKMSEQNQKNLIMQDFKSTNIYEIFNENIFKVSLPLTNATNNIYVYTTLDKKLQEALNEKLLEVSKRHNLNEVAVYGIKDGKIATGLSIFLKNDKSYYCNQFPNVTIQDLLKPILYTGLFNNNINVPTALLNNKIQNVINIKKFNPNELIKVFPSFSAKANLVVDSMDQNDNEKNALYNMLSQLVSLENELFNKLNSKDLENLTREFHLPPNSLMKQDNKITLKSTSLDNIVNSFAILNQEGKYYEPIYIYKINNEKIYNKKDIETSVNNNSINKAMNLINYEAYNNNKYKVLYDSNMALIYYNDYTVGVYINNPTFSAENKFFILKEISSHIVQSLVQNPE